ncbi:MAG TPA: type I methionyl aminopeptidase [Candidatus Saccharimonadales bacterium]|nr:type I methionyl aminopeptidase [Candidatus Saccharimonadales bacterium]
MNITIKNTKELETMAKGGKILSEVLSEVMEHIKPGVSELEIDSLAEKLIKQKGGEPGFKKVEGYHHTICVSTNDVVVHGIPTSYRFVEGDVVGIDCGVFLDGFHTDMSETKIVGGVADAKVVAFLSTGKKALHEAIQLALPGNHIGHISEKIQEIVEGAGYAVVRELIGHGVGRELHEDPPVPGYKYKKLDKTPLLREGMVIAIEIIYNMGRKEVVFSGRDDWTIKTKDDSLSGLFERTVGITKEGFILLTPEI